MPEQTPETFRNQLTQARERVDHVLDEILTTLPFAATDMGKAMHYGALLGGNVCARSWCTPPVKCLV